MTAISDRLRDTFAEADGIGWLHARDLRSGAEVGLDPDVPVAVASVIKIVFALAFAREATAGRLDWRERVDVAPELRFGGSGTAGFADPVAISLRDLALQMMTVSDNAATDVIAARTGTEAIDGILRELGLTDTHVRHDMAGAHERTARELGFPDATDLDARLAAADPDAVRALFWLHPETANASTAREMTTLLAAIWSDDEAIGSARACAFVRDAMAEQVPVARLASGFPEADVTVAAKSGTLPGIRNEAGVIGYPDGSRYAVAAFTRTESLATRRPALDAAIGRAARVAIEALRA